MWQFPFVPVPTSLWDLPIAVFNWILTIWAQILGHMMMNVFQSTKNLQEDFWASVLVHALVWKIRELVLHLLPIPSRRDWRAKDRSRCNWFHCNEHAQELMRIMEEAKENSKKKITLWWLDIYTLPYGWNSSCNWSFERFSLPDFTVHLVSCWSFDLVAIAIVIITSKYSCTEIQRTCLISLSHLFSFPASFRTLKRLAE